MTPTPAEVLREVERTIQPFAAFTDTDFAGSMFAGGPDDMTLLVLREGAPHETRVTLGDFRRLRAALASLRGLKVERVRIVSEIADAGAPADVWDWRGIVLEGQHEDFDVPAVLLTAPEEEK